MEKQKFKKSVLHSIWSIMEAKFLTGTWERMFECSNKEKRTS